MLALIQNSGRFLFEWPQKWLDKAFGNDLNPLRHLGSLIIFFLWIVLVSGIWITIFFHTSVNGAYESVEYLTNDQWYLGGVMRSLHRYASDAAIVTLVLHILKEFVFDRYRSARWFSWMTGVPLLCQIEGKRCGAAEMFPDLLTVDVNVTGQIGLAQAKSKSFAFKPTQRLNFLAKPGPLGRLGPLRGQRVRGVRPLLLIAGLRVGPEPLELQSEPVAQGVLGAEAATEGPVRALDRLFEDREGRPVLLAKGEWDLQRIEKKHPELKLSETADPARLSASGH